MDTPHAIRLCCCGTRLARHNDGTLCTACQKRTRDRMVGPPNVPRDFWQDQTMREALNSRHIGKIIAAYRLHAWHGQPISEVAAGWLNTGQSRLSRIENGPQIKDLDKLVAIAQALRIPAEHLWFALPGQQRFDSVVSVNRSTEFNGQLQTEILGTLDRARLRVDQTIASGSVSGNRLQLIEERVAGHVLSYKRMSPLAVLNVLTPDILEVESLASEDVVAAIPASCRHRTVVGDLRELVAAERDRL